MAALPREKWTDRVFRFDLPPGRMPVLLDRLRGIPARVEEKVRGVADGALSARTASGAWSVKDNIGHLIDLEELHLERLDQLERGDAVLRAADMENKATWSAGHNGAPVERLLAGLRESRARLIARLEAWDPAKLEASALHPRLKMPMRVVDVAYFTAEHDDYHLARMHELLSGRAGVT